MGDQKYKRGDDSMFKRKRREEGHEQFHLGRGLFKIRIPFVHYRLAWPEIIQGFLLVAVALAAVPFLMESLGVSHEIAVLMVIIYSLLYMLHPTLGDCMFPGWITAMIPLAMAWLLASFEPGTDRIHAVIAFQMLVAVLFLFLGITGVAKKLVSYIPASLRGGILMGAGIAATYSIVRPDADSRMYGIEMSGLVALIICLITMYSIWFAKAKGKSPVLKYMAKYGMLPALIVAYLIGVIAGELSMPQIEWGISALPVRELINGYTIFGIGFPEMRHFISAIPMVLVTYLIAFGEFIVAEAIVEDAGEIRTDEKIDYNLNRAHLIVGIRNFILSFIAPYLPLAGPNWMGGSITTYERYKKGREGMDSIHDGMSSFIFAMAIAGLFLPLVTLLQPAFPIAMLVTMGLSGFVCGYTAINMCKTREEQGLVLITGMVIAFQGATVGLITGVVLYLVLFATKKVKVNN